MTIVTMVKCFACGSSRETYARDGKRYVEWHYTSENQQMECVGSHSLVFERETAAKERVDHPKHYGGADNTYEAIKVIEAWQLEFCLGNTVKYIARAGKKEGASIVEDLKKARWYLDRRIQQLEKEAQS